MNMNSIMAQAQKMQRDMEQKQKEIYATEYTGTSQLVEVVMMGDKKIKSVKILSKIDNDDVEILEDMIQIAFNDALSKIDADIDAKMGIYGKKLGGLI